MHYSFQLGIQLGDEDNTFRVLPHTQGFPTPNIGERVYLNSKTYYIEDIIWEYREVETVISILKTMYCHEEVEGE